MVTGPVECFMALPMILEKTSFNSSSGKTEHSPSGLKPYIDFPVRNVRVLGDHSLEAPEPTSMGLCLMLHSSTAWSFLFTLSIRQELLYNASRGFGDQDFVLLALI